MTVSERFLTFHERFRCFVHVLKMKETLHTFTVKIPYIPEFYSSLEIVYYLKFCLPRLLIFIKQRQALSEL